MFALSQPELLEDEGFVLAKDLLGEDSLRVFYLTSKLGRWEGIAKKARKSLRRFGGGLEPFCLLDVACRASKGQANTFFLERSKPRVFFDGILASKQAALAGFLASDIVLNSQLGPGEALPSFSSYRGLLAALDAGEDPWSALLSFFEAFFCLIGIAPQLKRCVRCGSLLADHPKAGLSVSEAGAVCPSCLVKQERLLGSSLPLYAKGAQHALVRFYLEHWQYRFDRALLSYRVYREVSNTGMASPSEEGRIP